MEEATQKWPVKSTACASNKNKIFHRKSFCAALRLLSHLFNLYAKYVFRYSALTRVIEKLLSIHKKTHSKKTKFCYKKISLTNQSTGRRLELFYLSTQEEKTSKLKQRKNRRTQSKYKARKIR